MFKLAKVQAMMVERKHEVSRRAAETDEEDPK